ncbi:MAG: cytochrome c553 [Pseudohongiellaceae bacterium]|jgi:cytochrome c553
MKNMAVDIMNNSVKILTKSLITLLALVACGQAVAQGDAAAGADKIAICLACHGQDGNVSQLPNVPKIGGQSEKYLLKQMQDIKSGARAAPLMTGMLNTLDEQGLADVAAYYASQAAPQGAAEQDKVALGESLYRGGNAQIGVAACSACHSPNGQGLGSAGYPALSGQDPAYTDLQLRAFRDGIRQNDDAEVMRSIAARLNDEEIAALASYVSGLR